MAIYFVNDNNNAVYLLPDANIGTPSSATLVGVLGSAAANPRGLSEYNGRLHVVDEIDDKVYSFAPTTPGTLTDEGEFASALTRPLAITRIGSYFYVGDWTDDELWRYPVTGGPADAVSLGALNTAVDALIGFSTDGTDLYILDAVTPNLHRLTAANLTSPGNSVALTGPAIASPHSLFYFNGNLYSASNTLRLYRFNISGNTYTITDISALSTPASLLPRGAFGATHVPDPSTAPATPAAPTFDNATQTSLRINWVAPDDGGEAITSYDLRYREEGTTGWTNVLNQTGTSYTTPSTLDSATTYEAQVRATNSVGDSAYSASGTGTTLADLMPSAPTVADRQASIGDTVNITLPVGTGGDAPLSYSVSNLPAGLSFSAGIRRISGSPTTVQTRTVTYTVTDDDGDTDSTTFNFVVITPLVLSDWDDTGLDVEFSALIEVSSTANLYADSDRGGSDSPLDGELGIGADETVISRIRWDAANARLIFNDNDNPAALALNTYFGAGGDGNDLTFYVTDLSGTYTFRIVGNLFASGGSFLQFTSLSAALVAIFDDISVGDRLIFSAARVAVTIHEVAVSTTRTGGTVSAAVTKTEPSANPVSVSLTRTGGSVSAAVTKTEGLKLSDWDNTGLDVEFSALIEVSGTVDLYRDSDRGGSDTPIDGELGVGPNDTNLSRIRWDTANNRLIFNDNDSPGSLDLGAFFDVGGAGNGLTIYVTDLSGTYSFPVAGNIEFAALNAIRFENLPAALVTIFDNTAVDDRYIFSAGRVAPVSRNIVVSTTRTGGTVTAAVTKIEPSTRPIGVSTTRTGGTVTAAVTRTAVLQLSAWDNTGLDVEFSALIEVSATDNLYVDADRGGSDSPVDGELGLGDDETRISRIRWDAGNARLIFNDNNLPQDLDLSTYFGAGGDGNDLTFYVTDFSGTYTFNIADNILASGANFLQFSSLSATLVTIFDNIVIGDRLIFSAARLSVTSREVTVSTTRTGGTVTAAVVKTVPDIHEITVSLTRTGGTVSAAITKVGPSANPISVTLTRTGGTVSAAITKVTGGTVRQIATDITRTGGTVTAAVTRDHFLQLSAWDSTGLDVEFSALIEASGTVNLYRDSDRGGTDTPIDGELGVGPDNTVLSRIRWETLNTFFVFNDSNNPEVLDLGAYFSSGDGNELTIYFTDFSGTYSFPVSVHLGSWTASTLRFTILPNNLVNVLNDISIGDRFILSGARSFGTSRPIAVSLTRTGGTVTAAITKTEPTVSPIAATLIRTGGTVTAAVAKVGPSANPIAVTLTRTGGSVSVAVTKATPSVRPVAVAITRTGGSVTVSVTKIINSIARPVAVAITRTGGSVSVAILKFEGLQLSAFDTSGLQVDALALVRAGPRDSIFGRAPRDASGELLDGELDVLGDIEPITRLSIRNNGQTLVLNDSGPEEFSTYFGPGGTGEDLTITLQTADGAVSFLVSDTYSIGGGNFAQFTVPAADETFVDGIVEDTEFIFALARTTPPVIRPVAVTLTRTGGTVDAAVTKTEPSTRPISTTLTRTGGTVTAAVAKVGPSANPIAVTLTRTGGTVTAAVTKTEPSTRPIATTLTRTGGTVSAAITKVTGGIVRQMGAVLIRTGGTVTVAVTKSDLLQLTAWDNTGLDVEFSALIEVSAVDDLYRDSDRGGTDTPIAGELGVGTNDTNLSRIRWDTTNDRLVLNDNDSPGALDLGTFFDVGGAGNSMTVYVTDLGGTYSFPVSTHFLSGSASAARFQNLPTDLVTALDNILVGDRLIFSAARLQITARAIVVLLTRTGGTVTAAVTKVAPVARPIATTLTRTGGTVTAAIAKTGADVRPIAINLVRTGGVVTAAVTKAGASLHPIAVTLTRTGGTVSAAVVKGTADVRAVSVGVTRTGGTVTAAVTRGIATISHPITATLTRTGGTVTAAVTRGIATIAHPITATLTRTGGTVTAAVRSLTAASVTGTIVVQTTTKGYMSFNVERQPGTNQVILENVPEVNDIPDNAVFIARTAIKPTTWRVLSVRETAKNEFQVGALEHNPSKYDFIDEGLELEEDVTSVFPTGALAPPISLVASEVEYTEMGGAFIRLTLSIEAPIDPRIVGYAIETIAPSGVVGLLGPSRELTYEIENATAGDWEFKAFSLDAQGGRSVATAIDYTVVGATFPAGADGVGVEYIFTVYSDETLPTNRQPLNSWGYDEPGTRNGQVWTDEAQNETPTVPYLFRSERDAIGQPEVGDDVPDSWSEPKIVGHFGVDGVAFEYVYTAYSDETLPTNRQPLDTWGYDDPGTVNGQTWTDGAPSLTLTNSFLFLSQRRIVGAPVMGEDITDDWSTPVITGRYGQEGQAGLDGLDGVGVEYIFTAYSDETFPTNRRPLNTWGYDEPGIRNGQTWADDAPDTTTTTPFLFRSERDVVGAPVSGDDVSDTWSEPKIVGHFGADGEDGVGVEYIFTVYSDETLPTNRRPLNTWGYDDPGVVNGQTWEDGAPDLTLTNSFLFLSERQTVGIPAMGADVIDDWSLPVVIGRYGQEGQAGLDGEDGVGIEYIFTVYSDVMFPTNRQPLNTWGYDDPATRNGQTWTDGAPDTTAITPFLFRSERDVIGAPTLGDAVIDVWTEPKIVGHFGADGEDGDDGDAGQGFELVFARSSLSELQGNQHPDNGWGYFSPGVSNNLQWFSYPPPRTEATPNVFWARRFITGQPSIGDAVPNNWEAPVLISADNGRGIVDVTRDPETGFVTFLLSDGSEIVQSISDGLDGLTQERIFFRTQNNRPPATPTSEPAIDDFVPTGGYTDNPRGTDNTWRFEWEWVRRGISGNWGSWEGPILRNSKTIIPTGLEAWEPNIDFVMGQRTYVLTMTSIGPNMVSIPIVYTARQNHTSSSDDQPPNTTYWRTGDGSATQPIQAEWLLFNLRNLHRWEPAGLLGADKFVDKGVLPLDADARINSATFLEGNYYFCFTQSGTLINPGNDAVYFGRLSNATDFSTFEDLGNPAFSGSHVFSAMATINEDLIVFRDRIIWRCLDLAAVNFGAAANWEEIGTGLFRVIGFDEVPNNRIFSARGGACNHNGVVLVSGSYQASNAMPPDATNSKVVQINFANPSNSTLRGIVTNDAGDHVHVYSMISDGFDVYAATVESGGQRCIRRLILGSTSITSEVILDVSTTLNVPWGMAANTGLPEVIVDINAVEPTPPRNLELLPEHDGSDVALLWDQPNQGTEPITYNIERDTNSTFSSPTEVVSGHRGSRTSFDADLYYTDDVVSPGTQYYYRIQSVGPGGTSAWVSDDVTTPGLQTATPATPSNLSTSELRGRRVQVTWGGTYTNFDRFRIERATNSAFSQNHVVLSESLSNRGYLDLGLSAGQTYYYRVRAHRFGLNSPWAEDSVTLSGVSIIDQDIETTTEEQAQLVTDPQNVRAIGGRNQIRITWEPPAQGDPPVRYWVERAEDAGFSVQQSSVGRALDTLTFFDSGLSDNVRRWYRVRAANPLGYSEWVTVNATTLSASAVLPSAPENLSIVITDASSLLWDEVALSWDAPSSGDTPITYRVERAGNEEFTQYLRVIASDLINETFASLGIFSLTYYYRVIAVNAHGDGQSSEVIKAVIPIPFLPPTAIQNLNIAFEDNSLIQLSWGIPLQGIRPIRYKLERATNSGFTSNNVTLTTGLQRTAYTDPGPSGGFAAGSTYYYRVTPINISGEGPMSTVNHTTAAPDTTIKPSAIRNLRIGFVNNTSIDLKWAAPLYGTAITYTILRGVNPSFVSAVTLTTSITDLVYSDAGPSGGFVNGQTYYYRITPDNAQGDGPSRSTNVTVIVTTPEPDPDMVDPYAPELPFD